MGIAANASSPIIEQLPQEIGEILIQLQRNPMTNTERLHVIRQSKIEAEARLREQIINRRVQTQDLNDPRSALSLSFKAIDGLTALSEIQLQTNSQQASEASCGRARGLLTASNIASNAETVDLSPQDQTVHRLIQLICVQSI